MPTSARARSLKRREPSTRGADTETGTGEPVFSRYLARTAFALAQRLRGAGGVVSFLIREVKT